MNVSIANFLKDDSISTDLRSGKPITFPAIGNILWLLSYIPISLPQQGASFVHTDS